MLDINEVRMFVQVVRARSFAEAARRLRVPPNTLSRRIRQLESSLDTVLMQRSTRKLTLTAAGTEFFDHCAAAIDAVLNAGRALKTSSDKPNGLVRVAAPADFLDFFRIEWVEDFLRRYPSVRLDFVLSDARADLIEEGIDVALRGGRSDDMGPVTRLITSQHLCLVASPGYLTARGHPKTLRDLGNHDCLTVSSRQSRVAWTLQGPAGIEVVEVVGRFSANSSRALLKGCLGGLGIALLPTMPIAAALKAGTLERVLPEYRRDGADFNIVLPSGRLIPAAVSVFVDFVERALRGMDPLPPVASATAARRRGSRP